MPSYVANGYCHSDVLTLRHLAFVNRGESSSSSAASYSPSTTGNPNSANGAAPTSAAPSAAPAVTVMRHDKRGFRKIDNECGTSSGAASENDSTSASTMAAGGAAHDAGSLVFIPKARTRHFTPHRQDVDDGCDTDNASMVSEETPLRRPNNDEYRREYGKTLLAVLAVFITTTLGGFVIAYIHRFSVSQNVPLPDIVFNVVPEQKWAWEVADVTAIVCPLFGFLIFLFHKHYTIVFRRLCVMVALLYLIRALFLLCTYLPPPFLDFKDRCLPVNFSDNTMELFLHAFSLVFKVGFSSDNLRIMCGDTIFSGHAMVFTLICLMIRYYTPEVLRPYPLIFVVSLTALGVSCVIVSRQHYTVDVAVAVLVTCAVFYGYQRLTYKRRDRRCFCWRPWRFRPVFGLFLLFERRVPAGALPMDAAWPFPRPAYVAYVVERWNERVKSAWQTSSGAGDGRRPPPLPAAVVQQPQLGV